MAPVRDARLLARIRRGDSAAFEQLHARHQPDVLAFCRHLTGSREDAEDAVQHTFLAAYRRIAESEDQLDLRPWLFTVARNRCLSLLRARRSASADAVVADPATSFDGLAREVESRLELRDLVGDMARLPEPQRAALVLSQLDALSYRDIGAVLDVTPEKVKALVFQARSSLASTREAREAPCFEIRSELATARGAALRRRRLRRHVGQCDGCREFEVMVQRQRHDLDVLLPVVPTAGLAKAILGGTLGHEAGGAGAGAGLAAGGGAGALATLGVGGVAKLAVVVAIAGGGGAVAVAADMPGGLERVVPWQARGAEPLAVAEDRERVGRAPSPNAGAPGDGSPAQSDPGEPRERGGPAAPAAAPHRAPVADEGGDEDQGGPGAAADAPGDGGGSGLPPGLAKHDDLPPGIDKRDGLPPGLAKRGGLPPALPRRGKAPPGRSRAPKQVGGPAASTGGGQGNGAPSPHGNGNAGSHGNGVAPGQGNEGGQGNGNPGGQGDAGPGGGDAGGNGNENGNGRGNPH